MKIKYVCHGLISLHVNFHYNRTKWTLTSNIKICRWGGGGGKEKELRKSIKKQYAHNCQLVHREKFHCIIEILQQFLKLQFKIHGESGKEPLVWNIVPFFSCHKF